MTNLLNKQTVNFIMSADSSKVRGNRLKAVLKTIRFNAQDKAQPNRGVGDSLTAESKKKVKTTERASLIKLNRLGLSFENGKAPTEIESAFKLTPKKNGSVKDTGHGEGFMPKGYRK